MMCLCGPATTSNRVICALVLTGSVLLGTTSARAADEGNGDLCGTVTQRQAELRAAGKLRAARAQLEACEQVCESLVRQDCVARMAQIDTAMPTIVFGAKDAAGDDLIAVSVTVDGDRVADHMDGKPVAIDPGEHRVLFQTTGQSPIEKTLVVLEGEKNRTERVVFSAAANPRLPSSAQGSPARTATLAAPPLATHPVEGATQPIGARFWESPWFWAAVGAAAVIGGAIFLSTYQDNTPTTIHLQMQVPH